MPRIFTDVKREEIRRRLMDEGLEIIRTIGLNKMNIGTLTKRVGIAQGTFYNFFDSREALILEMGKAYQERLNTDTRRRIEEKGALDREDLRQLYRGIVLEDADNVYRFLTREDIQVLVTRLPKERRLQIHDIRAEMERNLSHVAGKKADCDLDAVINWIQSMNLIIQNRDQLVPSGIEKVISTMIEDMLDEIFE